VPKVVFIIGLTKGLLLSLSGPVWLWVGLGPGSKFSLWYRLDWVAWVKEIGPTDNSACIKQPNYYGASNKLGECMIGW